MRFRLTTILLACCSLLFAQQEATDLRRGNKQYNDLFKYDNLKSTF